MKNRIHAGPDTLLDPDDPADPEGGGLEKFKRRRLVLNLALGASFLAMVAALTWCPRAHAADARQASPLALSEKAAAPDAPVSTFEDSFGVAPALDSSLYGNCTESDWSACREGCLARGFGAYPVLQITCSIDNGDGLAHCGCIAPIPGPYNPPCYWNCGGGRTRSGSLY